MNDFHRRTENVLAPVQKQGKCGACWAYSVMETIQAHLAIHKSINVTLSVQQMIDCAKYGNNGCKGGDTCLLLEWLARNKVQIRTDAEYPLANTDQNVTCKAENVVGEGAAKNSVHVIDFTCNRYIGELFAMRLPY